MRVKTKVMPETWWEWLIAAALVALFTLPLCTIIIPGSYCK